MPERPALPRRRRGAGGGPLALLLGASALLSACADARGSGDREAWLVERLVDDNSVWLTRSTDLLATKYQRMAADPYDYMRGSLAVYLADQERPSPDRQPTAFVRDPALASLWIVGDPHPENLGTFRPAAGPEGGGDGVILDFNDFDGAALGPYLLDVRRAGVGVGALALGLEGCDAACAHAGAGAVSAAYADQLQLRGDGAPAWQREARPTGRILSDLTAEAAEEGAEQKRLNKYTELGPDGARRILVDDALDEDGSGILPLSREEADQLSAILEGYAEGRPFRVLDAARRFGAGVASLPAVRYVVLWDRGDDGGGDDALMTVREVVDPPSYPTLTPLVPALYEDNGARVEGSARQLWFDEGADPDMAGLSQGAYAFKTGSWSSWFQGLDHLKIREAWEEGDLDPADLVDLGDALGRLLADAHLRGCERLGCGEALRADVAGREALFAAEQGDAAARDLAQLVEDYALFQDALDRHGPLLGAEVLLR